VDVKFLIGEGIAHAKAAKDGKGGPCSWDALTCGCLIFDAEFLIGEGIAHAKPRQEYRVEPLTLLRSVSVNLAELRSALGTLRNSKCENVGKCECRNVVLWLEA